MNTNVKNSVKKLIGNNIYNSMRATVIAARNLRNKKIVSNYEYFCLARQKHNCFFGYYDVQQFSNDSSKVLACFAPELASPLCNDLELGYFNIDSKEYTKIGDTKAWCWQQGARLRWNPYNSNQVIFNDYNKEHSICRIVDITTGRTAISYNRAIYDLSPDMKYGVSVNYYRLQHFRPGYGYGRIEEGNITEKSPTNDGIYLINLYTGKISLIVSIYDIAKITDSIDSFHYLNHISCSPDGNTFIFFDIIDNGNDLNRRVNLFLSDYEGNIRLIDNHEITSHYCWIDDSRLMVTSICDGKQHYKIYNLMQGTSDIVLPNILTKDGHPSICGDSKFITDTYPDGNGFQRLFTFDLSGIVKPIANVYHYPYASGELRCDLHPRIDKKRKYICVDSLYHGKQREMIVFSGF